MLLFEKAEHRRLVARSPDTNVEDKKLTSGRVTPRDLRALRAASAPGLGALVPQRELTPGNSEEESVTKHHPGQMCPRSQMCPQDKQTQPPMGDEPRNEQNGRGQEEGQRRARGP